METKHFDTVNLEIKKRGLLWLPFLVLVILVLAFEIAPAIYIFLTSFNSEQGFTLTNYISIFENKYYFLALKNSIFAALSCSIIGILIGLYSALSLRSLKKERADRLITVINMTTNFSGVPLAFAFIILLGTNGLFTIFLKNKLHFDIYSSGFNLFSWSGITLVYVYFQIPLAIMLLYPAVDAIKEDVKEAAKVLGANSFNFWVKIGIPTIMPSLIGSFGIMFANALGAYATAYALVNSNMGLLSIVIANLVSGDITSNPYLASALATMMGGILIIIMFINSKLIKKRA